MNRKDERELDRLLAVGGVSGPERDEVLNAILTQCASQPRPKRLPWMPWVAACVAGGGALALLLLLPGQMAENDGQFRARGMAGEALTVEHACRPPKPGAAIRASGCRVDDHLLLRVDGLEEKLWVAVRSDDAGGITWYFPAADGTSPMLQPHQGPQLLPQAIVLSRQGPRALTVQFFRQPVDRAQAMAAAPWATHTITFQVEP